MTPEDATIRLRRILGSDVLAVCRKPFRDLRVRCYAEGPQDVTALVARALAFPTVDGSMLLSRRTDLDLSTIIGRRCVVRWL